jgi:hypothetical protein
VLIAVLVLAIAAASSLWAFATRPGQDWLAATFATDGVVVVVDRIVLPGRGELTDATALHAYVVTPAGGKRSFMVLAASAEAAASAWPTEARVECVYWTHRVVALASGTAAVASLPRWLRRLGRTGCEHGQRAVHGVVVRPAA